VSDAFAAVTAAAAATTLRASAACGFVICYVSAAVDQAHSPMCMSWQHGSNALLRRVHAYGGVTMAPFTQNALPAHRLFQAAQHTQPACSLSDHVFS
jgi:hypothetical protein